MPHKFHANRRAKILKQKHGATNWAEYNEGLRRRGDLTVWISEDALGLWSEPRRTTRGGQRRYSDLAIEFCLTLGLTFKQPLRPKLKSKSGKPVHLVLDSTGLKIFGEGGG